jgi:Uncharacterised protein family UPF0547/Holliday junction DNA helicase RuvB P-loop domain
VSPPFGINPGTIMGAMWIQQRDAQKRADWHRYVDQGEAERRHRELAEATRAASYRAEHEETESRTTPAPAPTPVAPPEPYRGPLVRVETLGLREVGPDEAAAFPEDLNPDDEAVYRPPSLLVVGGTEAAARQVAELVQERRGGQLREVEVADLRATDFAFAASSLSQRDVLFIPALDRVSADAAVSLATVMADHFIDVVIGTGEDEIAPFFVVARSGTGKVPAPLTTWGAMAVIPSDTKTCPQCAEEVKAAALICRFCRYEFGPLPPPGQPGA